MFWFVSYVASNAVWRRHACGVLLAACLLIELGRGVQWRALYHHINSVQLGVLPLCSLSENYTWEFFFWEFWSGNMCGILAVLGCSDDSQAKRARVLELSRRQSSAHLSVLVPDFSATQLFLLIFHFFISMLLWPEIKRVSQSWIMLNMGNFTQHIGYWFQ